jgi:hypothetical protein
MLKTQKDAKYTAANAAGMGPQRAPRRYGAQKTAFVFTDQLVAKTLFGTRVEAAQTQRFQIFLNLILQLTADIAPVLWN